MRIRKFVQKGTTTSSSNTFFHAPRARDIAIAQGTARNTQMADVATLSHKVRHIIGRYCSSNKARQWSSVHPAPTPPSVVAGLKASTNTMSAGTKKKTVSHAKDGAVSSNSVLV